MIRYNILVSGKVQGVGFRFFVVQQALELSITGFVRNNPDGTVEIDAQGSIENMQTFLSLIHKGSPFSKVSDVNTKKLDTFEDYTKFNAEY